jgi:hypothetical protein
VHETVDFGKNPEELSQRVDRESHLIRCPLTLERSSASGTSNVITGPERVHESHKVAYVVTRT